MIKKIVCIKHRKACVDALLLSPSASNWDEAQSLDALAHQQYTPLIADHVRMAIEAST
jgi:hypothetical protein